MAIIREILAVVGFLSAVYGVYLLHSPSAFIVGGAFLLWLSAPVKLKKGGKN